MHSMSILQYYKFHVNMLPDARAGEWEWQVEARGGQTDGVHRQDGQL